MKIVAVCKWLNTAIVIQSQFVPRIGDTLGCFGILTPMPIVKTIVCYPTPEVIQHLGLGPEYNTTTALVLAE